MGRAENKIAFVTGAAQGLGAAIASMLASEGARVMLTDINADGAAATAAEINRLRPESAASVHHDVTDEDRWREVLDITVKKFGGLNILVNNAGIGSVGSIEDESLENWHRVHSVDLDSVFLGCKHSIPYIASSGGGSIVNISSISGIIAAHNLAAYNSAKAAVRHLSKSVALHCAKSRNNIRCNSVHPVFIDTPILDGMVGDADRHSVLQKLGRQIPLGRVGQPDDVAYAVLYLASDESRFVTGTEIRVDGGISAM
ncbi:MAG: SDR family oxidoreductase [Gammaproteobacteria bacterium]|nr:SDR family oxidoreductase [Gammaproteobacteria bacterium]MDH4313441.1 SDR family oxidoreductase [Gammaproteobacteria bacterium]MDH5213017.1 SDR family oxidoreductase [Gammaproteobacteria bacterium]MDH5501676.1 SDR family oxidoreductase [Gammaproteobacteria bacterium]